MKSDDDDDDDDLPKVTWKRIENQVVTNIIDTGS